MFVSISSTWVGLGWASIRPSVGLAVVVYQVFLVAELPLAHGTLVAVRRVDVVVQLRLRVEHSRTHYAVQLLLAASPRAGTLLVSIF